MPRVLDRRTTELYYEVLKESPARDTRSRQLLRIDRRTGDSHTLRVHINAKSCEAALVMLGYVKQPRITERVSGGI